MPRKYLKPVSRDYAYPGFARYKPELKHFDTAVDATWGGSVITSPVLASSVLAIPEGAGENERQGRVALIKKMEWKGILGNLVNTSPAVGALPNRDFIFYIVLDRQCNGAAATQNDIFTEVSGYHLHKAFVQLHNSRRFKILKKFIIRLHQGGISANDANGKGDYVHQSICFSVFLHFQGTYYHRL
ncbi:putative viral capsid [Circoviridae 8 LDMD-2013]|uniref:putative viral capsid n=1 Tax=Circoviridae 8 LDMD-2013 TaxID=1379712 RepID=UPI0003845CCA|nr:putative viral capsid [Circoviridae 8 LDMD-2013]AGS36201.1 putative viral capsid [Circoviridae 8 LDMD-2013]